jgi:hypothetical protein
LPPLEGPQDDYRLLVNELMRLMLTKELFTFVLAKPNTVRLSASHSHLIPYVFAEPRYQGGCDDDAARKLLGADAGWRRHSGSAGGLEQGYLSGGY